MWFQKFKILIKGFFRTSIPIRGFSRKIFGLGYNVEHTREAMRYSYKRHVLEAQKGAIPLCAGETPHTAGLYGALWARYASANIPRPEILLWIELAPFLLMNKSNAIEALAEYVVCQENPGKGKIDWLSKLANVSLKTKNPNPDYVAMAVQAPLHKDIYWCNFLDKDTKKFLGDEFEKILSSKNKEETDKLPKDFKFSEKQLAEIKRAMENDSN